jgi:hypothetical protein
MVIGLIVFRFEWVVEFVVICLSDLFGCLLIAQNGVKFASFYLIANILFRFQFGCLMTVMCCRLVNGVVFAQYELSLLSSHSIGSFIVHVFLIVLLCN